MEDKIETYFTAKDLKKRTIFDIENGQEKCTPYTMAVLREQFDLAEELLVNGRSDKYYKN